MLTTGELYNDPGADYFTRQTPVKTMARAVRQLESLGYQVILEPLQQTGSHRSPHAPHRTHLIFMSEGLTNVTFSVIFLNTEIFSANYERSVPCSTRC